MPAVLGALTGAFVSFIPLYFIQNRAFKIEEKIRASEYKRSQQALGRSLLFKLTRIHSDIFKIHQYIEDSLRQFELDPANIEPWQILRQLAYVPPDTISISSEELGMLFSLGDGELFNTILNLEVAHNEVLSEANLYGKLRNELHEKIPVSQINGTIAKMDLESLEMLPKVKGEMAAINNFIKTWQNHSARYTYDSKQALEKLDQLLQNKLDLYQKVEFK